MKTDESNLPDIEKEGIYYRICMYIKNYFKIELNECHLPFIYYIRDRAVKQT